MYEENLGDAAASSINSVALSDPERLKRNHLLPAISEESLWVPPPVALTETKLCWEIS